MKVVDVEGLIDKLTYMGYFDENDELKEMIDMFTVCDLEQIRAEIAEYKDDKVIHAEVNEMIDIVLEIIDRYTK